MRDRMRRHGGVGLACLLATLAAGALASELIAPRSGWADASGCTLHPDTTPVDNATCAAGGDGCYICDYNYTGVPGYEECAESPDGVIRKCKRGVQPYHQYSGSLAGPAPATPAPAASGHPELPAPLSPDILRREAGFIRRSP